MNTKTLALTGLMMASAIITAPAIAEENTMKPYIGLDISRLSVDYATTGGYNQNDFLENGFTAINPYIGMQVNKNLAVELGYLKSNSQGKTFDSGTAGLAAGTDISTSTKIKGFHFDVVGNYQLNDKIDLLGSIGLARLKADITVSAVGTSVSDSESDTALRFGLGGNYAITDNVGIRGILRYMKVDFNDTADGMFQCSVGVNYKF